jgi:hypothetical protein
MAAMLCFFFAKIPAGDETKNGSAAYNWSRLVPVFLAIWRIPGCTKV